MKGGARENRPPWGVEKSMLFLKLARGRLQPAAPPPEPCMDPPRWQGRDNSGSSQYISFKVNLFSPVSPGLETENEVPSSRQDRPKGQRGRLRRMGDRRKRPWKQLRAHRRRTVPGS